MSFLRRMSVLLGLLVLGVNGFAHTATQIPWETSLEMAQAKAKAEGKPILLLHLFGRLDQEFT